MIGASTARLCLTSHFVSHVPKNDPRTIFGWAMYDWANSAYITTFAAIVAAFFTSVIVPDGGYNGYSGQTMWSAVISIGAFVLFLAMPVLGAIADYSYAKKKFLRFFAWFGAPDHNRHAPGPLRVGAPVPLGRRSSPRSGSSPPTCSTTASSPTSPPTRRSTRSRRGATPSATSEAGSTSSSPWCSSCSVVMRG